MKESPLDERGPFKWKGGLVDGSLATEARQAWGNRAQAQVMTHKRILGEKSHQQARTQSHTACTDATSFQAASVSKTLFCIIARGWRKGGTRKEIHF